VKGGERDKDEERVKGDGERMRIKSKRGRVGELEANESFENRAGCKKAAERTRAEKAEISKNEHIQENCLPW
jgi:hypothetical protein